MGVGCVIFFPATFSGEVKHRVGFQGSPMEFYKAGEGHPEDLSSFSLKKY